MWLHAMQTAQRQRKYWDRVQRKHWMICVGIHGIGRRIIQTDMKIKSRSKSKGKSKSKSKSKSKGYVYTKN